MKDALGQDTDGLLIEKDFPGQESIFHTERWFERTANASKFLNNKSKFYHLHIPKTAGNYLRSELTYALEKSFEENDIAFVVGHLGWVDYIDTHTYILNTFRDPVKRTVSHFNYMIGFPEYSQEGVIVEDVKNPTAKEFMDWVTMYPNYINNYQAKNLLFSAPLGSTEFTKNNFFFFKEKEFLNLKINPHVLRARSRRVDMQLRDTQLTKENMAAVKEDIFNSFGIQESATPHPMAGYIWHNVTDTSAKLYSKLASSDIDLLYELNKIDSELYFTDSLFWRDGK